MERTIIDSVRRAALPRGAAGSGTAAPASHPTASLPADGARELQVALDLCLDSPVAACVVWGSQPLLVANDACLPLLDARCRADAPQRAPEAWGQAWPVVGALVGQVFATGAPLRAEYACASDTTAALRLHGSPVRGSDGTVAGVFVTALDVPRIGPSRPERDLHEILDAMPAAIYTTDAQGRLTHFNTAAVEFSGRTPELGTDAWCVSWKLYAADGTPMPHDQCPMAIALKENRSVAGVEAIAERPDGSRRWFMPFPTPLRDAQGRVTGGINMLVDITARKRADAALRAAQVEVDRQRRLYEAILSNTPDLAYVFDLQHRFVYANESLLRMWGRTREEALGRTCLELGYERWHAAMHDREIDLVAATREPVRGRVPFDGVQGRRIYDYIFVPVIGADGEVTAVAGTTRDVTDATEAERALRDSQESQAFLLALGDTLRHLADPVGIQSTASRMLGEKLAAVRVLYVECEADGEHFTIGRAYEIPGTPSSTGRHRIDLLGTTALAGLRDGRTVASNDIQAAGVPAGDPAACAAFCIRAHVTVPLVKDGRLIALFSVHDSEPRSWSAAEIALVEETAERTWAAVERAHAEAALRTSRSQLLLELSGARRLQEISTELMHEQSEEAFHDRIIDAAIAIMRSDAATMQLHDGDHEGLQILAWKGFPDGSAPCEPEHAHHGCTCHAALAGLGRVQLADIEDPAAPLTPQARANYRRCGVRALQSTPLVSRSGELVGMLSTMWREPHRPTEHDFSLFDALARQATELIERVRADAAQRELIARLAEQDRRKDEFLASLAHELRNPLAPLRNGLELMKLARDDAATVQRARTVMERQLRQMVRLVDDLLDVSRISRGTLLLQPVRLDLASVLASAVETSRPLIDAAGHVLAVELPPEPVFVDADETRLAQAFANLLNNAARYTEAGGRIVLAMRREHGEIIVLVRDNGIGIPPDMLPRVFDMFTQVDATRDRSRGGLGIGLTLVRRLVELHHGTVEAHSAGSGSGSTFTVRLPLADATPALAGDVQRSPLPRASGRRVLIADDNRDAAASLAIVLDMMGNTTRVAHDAAEALALAAAFLPDIALLDIGMPEVDGHELARRIREQPWGRTLTLIALTGWGQEEDRRRSQAAGFDHHLVKPVEFEALQKLLAV